MDAQIRQAIEKSGEGDIAKPSWPARPGRSSRPRADALPRLPPRQLRGRGHLHQLRRRPLGRRPAAARGRVPRHDPGQPPRCPARRGAERRRGRDHGRGGAPPDARCRDRLPAGPRRRPAGRDLHRPRRGGEGRRQGRDRRGAPRVHDARSRGPPARRPPRGRDPQDGRRRVPPRPGGRRRRAPDRGRLGGRRLPVRSSLTRGRDDVPEDVGRRDDRGRAPAGVDDQKREGEAGRGRGEDRGARTGMWRNPPTAILWIAPAPVVGAEDHRDLAS